LSAPTVTRSPDSGAILDFATIDHWSEFVRVLAKDTVLRIRLMNACRSGDPRLKAYTAFMLHEAMATAMQVTLDDAETADLAEQLDAARQVPDECAYCDSDSVVTVQGRELCSEHAKALDMAEAAGEPS
jgi:hypothetical protein